MSLTLEKWETCPNGCGSLEWAYDAQSCFLCGHDGMKRSMDIDREKELYSQIKSLRSEIERLHEQLTRAIEREHKIASAGEKLALRLAEYVAAASRANVLLGENDMAWPDYAEEAWNILARVLDPDKSVCQATEIEGEGDD